MLPGAGARVLIDPEDPEVVSQLSGSHGEWTQSDDVEKGKDGNDARKRAKKEAETNKHRGGAQHKAKKGEKEPKKVKPNCKFFAKGACKYGDKCRFNHPATLGNAAPTAGQKAYMAVLAGRPDPESEDKKKCCFLLPFRYNLKFFVKTFKQKAKYRVQLQLSQNNTSYSFD